MTNQTILLGEGQDAPRFTFTHLEYPEKAKRPCVVVIPGGGYTVVCKDREGERIALAYNAAGFHTAILEYTVGRGTYPKALLELAETVKIIRRHAEEWDVDPGKIAVAGFSAGAHLAASLAVLWKDEALFDPEEIVTRAVRPDAQIPVYGVLERDECIDLYAGDDPAVIEKLDLVKRVGADTPPAFLAHTAADRRVPVANSLHYAEALDKAGVPFELHVFPSLPHGMSLASDETIWSRPALKREYPWMKLSIDWLAEVFGLL
ncbi:MAG: alpha/beta hydrolase [Clostridia bacterium]|nr:alpha/beta hydrolase [Clostridia bacterium]